MDRKRLAEIKARWRVGQPRTLGSPLWREQEDVDWLVDQLKQDNCRHGCENCGVGANK